jgi:hypothetical protein
VLDEIIAWRERFNRLVELRSKLTVSAAEHYEMLAIQQEFRRDMAKQKALRRLVL